MQQIEPISCGNFYHVLNHGTGNRDLFPEPENCSYFLSLCDKYLKEVVEVYAWVLMPNHFHMLLRVVDLNNPDGVGTPSGLLNTTTPQLPYHLLSKKEKLSTGQQGGASHQLSKMFNAYAQALNKRMGTWGGLFERPFRRKLVDSERYLQQLVLYIHLNPVHHGFCNDPAEYPWSSFLAGGPQTLGMAFRPEMISWFGGEENYFVMHRQRSLVMPPADWMLE